MNILQSALSRLMINLSKLFQDHRAAFKNKTTWEVVRALVVFQLCGVKVLVNNNEVLMKIGKRVLGKTLFAALMKPTFYGQFVAGEVSSSNSPLTIPLAALSMSGRPFHRA